MKKYEIIKTEKEFTYKERNDIETGCTTYEDPEILASFETLDEAKEALKKYETETWIGSSAHYNSLATIAEYSIQENEYDEDGEWISGGDVWDTTELPSNPFDDAGDEDDE